MEKENENGLSDGFRRAVRADRAREGTYALAGYHRINELSHLGGRSDAAKDTIREAISIIVARLAAADSQAEHEEGGGGLRTITFADGQAHDIGDLNPNNLKQIWSRIRWSGGTRIMPGFNQLLKTYTEEFGSEPPEERPLLLALVITDGEADDTEAFKNAVARAAGNMYVVLAIIGYGPE